MWMLNGREHSLLPCSFLANTTAAARSADLVATVITADEPVPLEHWSEGSASTLIIPCPFGLLQCQHPDDVLKTVFTGRGPE
jgi:hypothetical protein